MWWLAFLDGDVVLVEASSLLHARTVAAQFGLGRVSHFAEGHFIAPDRAALIPYGSIGRMLTPLESRQVLDLLERRSPIEPSREPGLTQPRRRE
jgi:hypothetical protein